MNTIECFRSNRDVAEFVNDLLNISKLPYAWTITIKREKLGGYSVTTVIDGLLEDTETHSSSEQPMNT